MLVTVRFRDLDGCLRPLLTEEQLSYSPARNTDVRHPLGCGATAIVRDRLLGQRQSCARPGTEGERGEESIWDEATAQGHGGEATTIDSASTATVARYSRFPMAIPGAP